MSGPESSGAQRVPTRAASLQRMLELERKHKMERLQQGALIAPEYQPHARSSSPLQSRRRDPSPQQQRPAMLTAADRSHTLPALSVSIPHPPPNAFSKGKAPMRDREMQSAQITPVREDRKDFGPRSHPVKTVTFLPPQDEGEVSDHSSICHSPTWDGYGQKKKKKKEEAELKKKEKERATKEAKEAKAAKKKTSSRLTKGPPPAIETRHAAHVRSASAPLLDAQHPPLNAERQQQSDQVARNMQGNDSEESSMSSRPGSIQSVQNVVRSPGFIGGVRLERERDAAMRRLMDARNGAGRPAPDPSQQHQKSYSAGPDLSGTPSKKRDTAPTAVYYPPTSSKTHNLKERPGKPHTRSRSSSLLAGAAKLLNPRGHDYKGHKGSKLYSESHGSQDSVQTVQTVQTIDSTSQSSSQDRGRKPDGSVDGHSRAQSYDSRARSVSESIDERRGGRTLPHLSKTWSNTFRSKTTSMVVLPPESARGSFTAKENEAHDFTLQNDFSFLSEPFSPLSVRRPPSPPGSLSASMKAKTSPQLAPTIPPAQPQKKGFRTSIIGGLKSSLSPNPVPPFLRRAQTDTVQTTGLDTYLSAASHPLQSHPLSTTSSSKLAPVQAPQATPIPSCNNEPEPTTSPREAAVDHRGSGASGASAASSASSHPDSESLPPSPMTTPDTSRPQSRKDSQGFHMEETRRTPVITAVEDGGGRTPRPHIASVLLDYDSSNYSSQANSRPSSRERSSSRGKQERIKTDRDTLPSQGRKASEEKKVAEDIGLSGEMWTGNPLPLDSDQLSFTSAVTHLDVKTSMPDLSQIEPLSLDAELKGIEDKKKAVLSRIMGPSVNKSLSETDLAGQTVDTSFLPPLRHQALTPRSKPPTISNQLRIGIDVDQKTAYQPPSARTASPDRGLQPPNSALAYLQEARKAVSPSPRSPKNTSSASLPTNLPSAVPRPALMSPGGGSKPFVPTSSHLSLDTTGLKPIAKMFVECCSCKFYHDMPSRVYEAMAKPDDLVKDSRLGVFGAVTTCVKCPWCAHNMSTQCCAGYAAVVYLREKLHGA